LISKLTSTLYKCAWLSCPAFSP